MTAPSAVSPLLESFTLGDVRVANRVVMAPLTRARATNRELVPTALHVDYYAQRASAGLIVSEGVWVSEDAIGWNDVPGIFTDEQVRAWRPVTRAVHDRGGVIMAQLWHAGAMSHPDLLGGAAPLAPSAIDPQGRIHTAAGVKPSGTPRAMVQSDIDATVDDFARAAANAMRAGFDGVQLQAGFHYLFNQFMNPLTNTRMDRYGGSLENRIRLLFDVLDAVDATVDVRRVGVKTGPALSEAGRFVTTPDTVPTSDAVINRLNDYHVSHLLLMGAMADLTGTPAETLAGDGMYHRYRQRFTGPIIANVDVDVARGERLVRGGLVDMVAFGRPYIANPDLPERIRSGTALSESDPATYYGHGERGYTDYPTADEESSVR